MDASLRLLLVAEPAAAGRAVEPVRRSASVEASVAPTAAILVAALRDAALRGTPWSAVVVVPSGPVADADVCAAVAGQSVPLVVVADPMPASFASAAALALPEARLALLPDLLSALAAETAAAASDAFVGVANAALAESARVTAALPAALAAASTPARPAPAHPPSAHSAPAPLSEEAEDLARHLPIGLYRTTPGGRILYANAALADVLGVESVAALRTLDLRRDLGYPHDTFAEEMRRAGTVRNLTVRWTTPRGRAVVTRENARAVLDASGAVAFYDGTIEDVTSEAEACDAERARARHHEAVLRFAAVADGAATPEALHQAAVRSLLDAVRPDWVLLVQHDAAAGRNRIVAWAGQFSAAAAEAFSADYAFARLGFTVQPALIRDTESGGGARLPASIAARMRAHGIRAVGAFPLHRGETPLGAFVVGYDAPHTFTVAERQTAESLAWHLAGHLARHRAEQASRASEARYRVLASLTSDYAFAVRTAPDGREQIEWATEACARISGFTPEEMGDLDGLRALVHPDSHEAVAAAIVTLGEAHSARVEARIVTRSGDIRWLDHSARLGEVDIDGSAVVYHSGQDVTARKQAEAALVAAREQAEELARLKTAFLANMSHEIRTPLTGILGYAELLADEVGDEHRDFVTAISTSGVRLLETLNSVLDLARLESDGVRPDLRRVDVSSEVRAAVAVMQPLADRRGLALSVEAPAPAEAMLDAACLGRIATNLVGNAIKFTEAGAVRVSVDTVGESVRVRVTDTGIGIPDAFLPHLFDEFRQETDGPARIHEGSGLGLAITRRLAELMGGTIAVESRRPGGSSFTVTFPAAASPADAASPAGATDVPGPDMPDDAATDRPPRWPTGLPPPAAARPALTPARSDAPPDFPAPVFAPTSMFNFRFTPPPSPDSDPASPTTPAADAPSDAPAEAPAADALAADAPAASQSAPVVSAPTAPYEPPSGWTPLAEPVMIVRPAREAPPADPPAAATDGSDARPPVLVVEDNLDTRMLLERILRASYDVTAVGDARSALAAMSQRRFRGFVLDINLGGKETGTDVLRVARTLEGYDDVYAVALTAYALPGDRDRLIESGFDEYISKPFTRQSLLDALAAGIQA